MRRLLTLLLLTLCACPESRRPPAPPPPEAPPAAEVVTPPAPTSLEALRAAYEVGVPRTVYMTSSGTIAVSRDGETIADEQSPYATEVVRELLAKPVK